jgi:hydrogenase maturation protease
MTMGESARDQGVAGAAGIRHETVAIGIGNPLMGDDGIGLAALQRLRAWEFEPYVEQVDGGTWGMNLLQFVEEARRLLVMDAIEAGLEPGALVTLEGDEIPRFLSTKLSPHQIELREVLALAELRGQPGRVEMSEQLSPEVEGRLDEMVETCVERLRSWGHRASPGPKPHPKPAEPTPTGRRPLPW